METPIHLTAQRTRDVDGVERIHVEYRGMQIACYFPEEEEQALQFCYGFKLATEMERGPEGERVVFGWDLSPKPEIEDVEDFRTEEDLDRADIEAERAYLESEQRAELEAERRREDRGYYSR